jgi:hypothetical protein
MGRRALSEIVCMPTTLSRGAWVALLLAASAFTAACGSNGSGQPDGGPVCRQGFTDCDGGTQCTNGICEPTCASSGAGCPAGTYCESSTAPVNICSPIQTTACATDLDCPIPQSCAPGGICSSLELQANGSQQGCSLGQANDKCAPDSICYQVAHGTMYLNYCVGLSHCSEDGGCPSSTVTSGSGSVCNALADGGSLFPDKERLCLYGYCVNDTHCPGGYACFHRDQANLLGQCQGGLPNEPCYTRNDCFNSPTGCEAILDGGFDGGQNDGGSLGQCY